MSEDTEFDVPAGVDQWPKLTVKDFGPVAEGEVELRPLTVFVGPDNTGKTWIANLIYALGGHLQRNYGFRNFEPYVPHYRGKDPYDDGLDNFPEDPDAWLQSLRERGAIHLTDGGKRTLKSIMEGRQEALKEEILRCFGLAESRDLVRELGTGTAEVTLVDANGLDSFATNRRLVITREGDFSLGVDVMTSECRPSSKESLAALDDVLEELIDDSEYPFLPGKKEIIEEWRSLLFSSLTDIHCYRWMHYLPADRGGIMKAHRSMFGALIRSASHVALERQPPLPKLAGVLGDFLDELVELADHRLGDRSGFTESHELARKVCSKLTNSLEQQVLGGKVDIEKSDDDSIYPHFTYRPDKWKRDLSLTNASSMVSELAPVALYLRHCVRPEDLLILEEPEAHLHPAEQVRFIREIAEWVRQGIRVLIITHSEWMLEEIANIVAAGESEKEDGLKRAEVGMWLFESKAEHSDGSSIREIEWSVDEGGYDLDFDDVAIELHNKWANLVRESNE